eukprot:scaffold134_cov94-Amphora_coffeaeformis.AAC.8
MNSVIGGMGRPPSEDDVVTKQQRKKKKSVSTRRRAVLGWCVLFCLSAWVVVRNVASYKTNNTGMGFVILTTTANTTTTTTSSGEDKVGVPPSQTTEMKDSTMVAATTTSPHGAPSLSPSAHNDEVSSSSSSSSSTTTTTTRISRLSLGMDLMEHVCVQYGGKDRNLKIRSYVDDNNHTHGTTTLPPQATLLEYYSGDNHKAHMVTTAYPAAQWKVDTSVDTMVVPQALWTHVLYRNPGHCINDLAFTLALDRYQRSSLLHNRSSSKSSSSSHDDYFYSMPIVKANWHALAGPEHENTWCYQFLRTAGLVDHRWDAVPSTTNTTKASTSNVSLLCFDQLYMPAMALYRFPVNESEFSPISRQRQHEELLRLDKDRRPASGDIHKPAFPRQALWDLRTSVLQGLQLITDPWPLQQHEQQSKEDHDDVDILFYNRAGTHRRIWSTAGAVREQLQHDYRVRVRLVQEEWNTFSFAQQLQLYHNYSYIVSVHGAHLANLMAARPGTRVVEILCRPKYQPSPLFINQTTIMVADTTTTNKDDNYYAEWYGPLGWFSSWTRRMDIHHFIVAADPGCQGLNDAQWATNVTRTVKYLASRFQLRPR